MGLTISDTVRHARAATDPVEATRLLMGAFDVVERCWQARQVLWAATEIPGIPDATIRDLVERTLGLADVDGEGDFGAFEDAAEALAIRLHDPDAARATLERGERSLIATDARGFLWTLLAKSYGAILGDRGAIARCLTSAEAVARRTDDASDLAYAASVWAEFLDREQGISRIAHAETRICDAQSAWGVANAWHGLGDLQASRRVLDRALAGASSSQEALTIAKAFASHHDRAEAMQAFTVAEGLARDFRDHYRAATAAYEMKLGEEVIRRTLGRAEALQSSEDQGYRLSMAYRVWLDDIPPSERLVPDGVRPEELRPRLREMAGWSGSEARLFDLLRARVDEPTLLRIARADYGADVRHNFDALTYICRSGVLPRGPLPWHPGEVLELTRWSEGENTDHLARALACTILCLGPSGALAADIATNGPILLESCLALGGPMPVACVEFFVWLAETCPHAEDEVCARLLVLLAQAAIDPDDSRLPDLAAQVATRGLEPIAGSMRERLWWELIDRLLTPRPELQAMVLRALQAD